MSLKYSGLIFVFCITLVAINGTALNNGSSVKTEVTKLPELHTSSEKSQSENGASTTESVDIIIHNTSENISKSNGTALIKDHIVTNPKTVTPTTTTTTTTTTTPTPTTPTRTPTTPPAPNLASAPGKGNWVVRNETTNTTCIIAGMTMQLNITYPSINETELNAILNIPKNAVANGSCSQPNQTLIIHWGPGHSLQINFSSNKTAKNFYISELSLNVNATVFKGAKDNTWKFKNTSFEFATPLEMSYKCNKAQDINLNSEDDKLKAVLSLNDTQFEAFMNKTKAEFGAVQDCDTFDTPDIVPIAVGCALAILVLVVLAAYLIGRKRSQNQGYLSM